MATVNLFCVPDVTVVTGNDFIVFECFISTDEVAQIAGIQIDLPCDLLDGSPGISTSGVREIACETNADCPGDFPSGNLCQSGFCMSVFTDVIHGGFPGDALFGFTGIYAANLAVCNAIAAPAPGLPPIVLPADSTRYLATFIYRVSECAGGSHLQLFEGTSDPPADDDLTRIRDTTTSLLPFTASKVEISVEVGQCCGRGLCFGDLNEECCAVFGGMWRSELTCDDGCHCDVDSDCNDDILCNGVETCIDGVCVGGVIPCVNSPGGPFCSEALARCVECLVSGHCDDGLFCDGAEECVGGECEAGVAPCAARETCNEEEGCVAICPLDIVRSNPPSGSIDARQTSELDGGDEAGWEFVSVSFDGDAGCLSPEDFVVTTSPAGGPAMSVVSVVSEGNSATLKLNSRITPGFWTQITHADGTPTSLCLGYLPGDVTGDGTSSPLDILRLVDCLNGVTTCTTYQDDPDRSGNANAEDIIRVIDLLNGADAFEAWNGVSIGSSPCE